MPTLTELIEKVYEHTNRSDLSVETKSQVKKAVMKLHGKDFFKKDLKQVIITPTPISPGVTRYQLDLSDSATFPLVRRVCSITPLFGGEENKSYDEMAADDLMDSYRMAKTDIFFQIGLAVNVRASRAPDQIAVTYWKYPNVTDSGFSSWIVNEFEDAVVEEAARVIFKMIGKDEEFQKYEKLVVENETAIIAAGI